VEEELLEWRAVSDHDLSCVKAALEELRDDAPAYNLPPGLASGLTPDVIMNITVKCKYISSSDDVLVHCPVYSFKLAQEIWMVLSKVFNETSIEQGDLDYVSDDD
jgi:hypothetical protein